MGEKNTSGRAPNILQPLSNPLGLSDVSNLQIFPGRVVGIARNVHTIDGKAFQTHIYPEMARPSFLAPTTLLQGSGAPERALLMLWHGRGSNT